MEVDLQPLKTEKLLSKDDLPLVFITRNELAIWSAFLNHDHLFVDVGPGKSFNPFHVSNPHGFRDFEMFGLGTPAAAW